MRKMKPFGGMKRKYAEGGDTGVREGRNRNIDDATRQRALDRMEAQRVLESMKASAPKAATPAPTPKPRPKPKAMDTGDETARLAKRAPAPARKMGIYERSRAVHGTKFLPDPINTTPSNVDTPDIRRQARLRKEAAARAAERRAARERAEATSTAGDTVFRKGGSIRANGVARKGLTKGKMR